MTTPCPLQHAQGSWYFGICTESRCSVLPCSVSASGSHHAAPTECSKCVKSASVGTPGCLVIFLTALGFQGAAWRVRGKKTHLVAEAQINLPSLHTFRSSQRTHGFR